MQQPTYHRTPLILLIIPFFLFSSVVSTSAYDNMLWASSIKFSLTSYSSTVSFAQNYYTTQIIYNANSLNLSNFKMVNTGEVTRSLFGIRSTKNLVVNSLKENTLSLTISDAGTVTLFGFSDKGSPTSVSGYITSYAYSSGTITIVVSKAGTVVLLWGGLSENNMNLILFIIGFMMFFVSLGVIAYKRMELSLVTALGLSLCILIGFGLMVGAGA